LKLKVTNPNLYILSLSICPFLLVSNQVGEGGDSKYQTNQPTWETGITNPNFKEGRIIYKE
jgi:hypothetical protein